MNYLRELSSRALVLLPLKSLAVYHYHYHYLDARSQTLKLHSRQLS